MSLSFTKMSGAGNDFIMIDNRDRAISAAPDLARRLCRRGTSIGADGLILIEPAVPVSRAAVPPPLSAPGAGKQFDFTMRIFNSDGSEAEMCGNGARCAVIFADRLRLVTNRQTVFNTLAGPVQGWVIDEQTARITLRRPEHVLVNQHLVVNDQNIEFHFTNTGVPHTIIFPPDLETVDVNGLGRAIRFHRHFQPAGTNVNFVRLEDSHTLSVRTYERGVEAETLACGTGATASVIAAIVLGKLKSPAEVITRSGLRLGIECEVSDAVITRLTLRGEARIVYTGTAP